MASEGHAQNGHADSKAGNLHQTTKEQADAATKAAKAVRPPPSPVVSEHKSNVQKAWFRFGKALLHGSAAKSATRPPAFNPELLTNQKREWTYLQKINMGNKTKTEPTAFFEHFVVVGLHPDSDLESTEEAFKMRKVAQARKEEVQDPEGDYRGFAASSLEPQVLFKYPPAKRLALRDLPGFCFPNGVQARVMERTPSMSDFNEVVYGQAHLKRDDQSFVFLLKVANNVTLYGVCMMVQEIVQRPPGILALNSAFSPPHSPLSKYLISAPRCYCMLTQLPFFELHFEVLNCIMAQERLERIKQHMTELEPEVPRLLNPEGGGEPEEVEAEDVWMKSAIPASILKGGSRDDLSIDLEGLGGSGGSGEDFEGGGNSEHEFGLVSPLKPGPVAHIQAGGHQRTVSVDSVGSVRSYESEDEFAEAITMSNDFGVAATKAWAEAHNNDSLRIVCAYHSAKIPERGQTINFQPLEHLQPSIYTRPQPLPVAIKGHQLDAEHLANCVFVGDPSGEAAAQMSAEEARAVAPWAIASLCGALSLENILILLQASLLEKQILVICSNLGVLSSVVISLIPMLRPFVWQSVLLPILPSELLAFLDAPVPFIVGVPHKTPEVRQKSANLIRINVYKDEVKLSSSLPPLPQHEQLVKSLKPLHAQLAGNQELKRRPIHRTDPEQTLVATKFLAILRHFLEALCANLELHSITDVRPGGDRVSLLLKESFVASYPIQDRPFVKLFTETQLFAVHSDAILSSMEAG